MLEYYDPNILMCTHTIRITFMQWSYVGHIAYEVRGNTRGANLLTADFLYESDADDVENLAENDCNFEWVEDAGIFRIILTNPDGERLQMESEPDELEDMVVSVEIVEQRVVRNYGI